MHAPFFEDLAMTVDSARAAVREAVSADDMPIWVDDPRPVDFLRSVIHDSEGIDALVEFVSGRVISALHSALVTIDGGSASAEVGRIALVDDKGESLGEGLHELFIGYLFDTGRLT